MALKLTQEIQLIVQNVVKGMKLADVSYGKVTKESPLEIELEQTMLPLRGGNLVLTDSVKKRIENVDNREDGSIVEVQHDLKVGDRVVMLRAAGGQTYVVLSKAI